MKKIAFFAFKGTPMCFIHVLLNAIDLKEKGYEVQIIIEGEAVVLLEKLEESRNQIYLKAKEMNILNSICKACSIKLNVIEFNKTIDIPIKGEMSGHISMEEFINNGYEIITL